MDAFFQLHRDLPREGPGDQVSLDRALTLAQAPSDSRMLDAGCGPGADIEGLLAWCPEGHVLAVDPHAPFVEQARVRHGGDPRVEPRVGDMRDAKGPFDLIWCAGALYFLGLEEGLKALGEALAPEGVLAFSHPCWFVDAPSAAAVALWEGEGVNLLDRDGVCAAVSAAGFDVLGVFPLSDEAWEAYYGPMEARIEALAATATADLTAVLEEGRREAAAWRQVREETGYLQVVARRTGRGDSESPTGSVST